MRLILSSLLVMLLVGCASNRPTTLSVKWPDAPADLLSPACELKPIPPDQNKLDQLIENANENYSCYYQVREKFEGWQDW